MVRVSRSLESAAMWVVTKLSSSKKSCYLSLTSLMMGLTPSKSHILPSYINYYPEIINIPKKKNPVIIINNKEHDPLHSGYRCCINCDYRSRMK